MYRKKRLQKAHKNVAAFHQLLAHESGHFLFVVYTIMPDRGHVDDHFGPFSLFIQSLVLV